MHTILFLIAAIHYGECANRVARPNHPTALVSPSPAYRNYPTPAQPTFIATNTLNIVTKYWINKWETQINATYGFASGRPYFNPASPAFLANRTPDYHNLALTVNKLFSIRRKWFTVVFVGIGNVLNRKNIFGYSYRSPSDVAPRPRYPALFRSFFVGFNMSRTEFNRYEL